MERKLLTDEDRSLLRSLLTERIGTSVSFPDDAHGRYSADQCFLLLKKIDGPGKVLVIESQAEFATDAAVQHAEQSGCG